MPWMIFLEFLRRWQAQRRIRLRLLCGVLLAASLSLGGCDAPYGGRRDQISPNPAPTPANISAVEQAAREAPAKYFAARADAADQFAADVEAGKFDSWEAAFASLDASNLAAGEASMEVLNQAIDMATGGDSAAYDKQGREALAKAFREIAKGYRAAK